MRYKWEQRPRCVSITPWWWDDFIEKLNAGQVYAKGDKGDKGDPGGGTGAPSGGVASVAPANCKKVTNIYVNEDGKIVVEYDDIP